MVKLEFEFKSDSKAHCFLCDTAYQLNNRWDFYNEQDIGLDDFPPNSDVIAFWCEKAFRSVSAVIFRTNKHLGAITTLFYHLRIIPSTVTCISGINNCLWWWHAKHWLKKKRYVNYYFWITISGVFNHLCNSQ